MRRKRYYSRRRWSRRGRGIADFVFGFATSALEHTGCFLWRGGCALGSALRRTWAHGFRGGHRRAVGTGVSLLPGPTASEEIQEFVPVGERPTTRFDDVAGLGDAKQEIRLRMILPVLHPDLATRYGVRVGGGILLYGPPGTGKTMLAKATAHEVDAAFFHIRPSDILSGEVGQAEKNVRRLFETVRKHPRSVLFLDECEAFVPSRRRNQSTIMQRVISEILGEVDGFARAPSGHVLLLIGATNEVDMIDPAMLRPGRFDAKVFVGPPDLVARQQLIRLCLNGRPIAPDMDVEALARETDGMTGAEIRNMIERAADSAFLASLPGKGTPRPINMQDVTACIAP